MFQQNFLYFLFFYGGGMVGLGDREAGSPLSQKQVQTYIAKTQSQLRKAKKTTGLKMHCFHLAI